MLPDYKSNNNSISLFINMAPMKEIPSILLPETYNAADAKLNTPI